MVANKYTIDQQKVDKKLINIKLQKIIKTLPKGKIYNNFITNSINEVAEYEIGFEAALSSFDLDNEENYLSLDIAFITKLRKHFSKLLFLDRMIHITGNSSFRDDIMKGYINGTMFPSDDVNTNNTNNTNNTTTNNNKDRFDKIESMLNSFVK